ncbi:double-strand break repair helicase AddA [Mesobacterium sp. TK19101]|uniref:DNA 3'-5' helicase n=1 Tax=Mesobacterium hydrothermale TaxID=3111907 RepID=A0ABU6HGW7_9RHOB|nr:double-strand break repair helicase AddA [Mesobacterium sp. TK19101]MEC3861601.1 double-strand break repair helicase AddA [Mesobacterium sp. TK19101]
MSLPQFDEATLRQVEAAEPGASTWLSANAGSGKTRVLTDRVARLLLRDVPPDHILCLTYTKAAATEMQNRLFKRLGEWAMLDDTHLGTALAGLGVVDSANPDFLRNARTLFARAIETPGGLRIQTIHSFCSALLRRFPLEAGVSPQFKEIEDRAAELLREEVLDRIAEGPDAGLVTALAGHSTDQTLDAVCAEITRNRDVLLSVRTEGDIRTAYGLSDRMDVPGLLDSVFLGGELEMFAEMIPVLRGSGSNDNKLADKLTTITAPDLGALQLLEDALLNGSTAKEPFTAKIGKLPTKALANGPLAHLTGRLDDLMRRVESARETRLALMAADRDIALHRFATVFLAAYEAEKQRRGWLDFDDLIALANRLLDNPAVAEWVLYRLDGGIDHILVDEAQDTSPTQWRVIERLAREFTSGEGARADVARTIFVVGDKKQSIYSFQGADAREFDRMRAEFAARLRGTNTPLNALSLEHSFRSAWPILRLVDLTFENRRDSGFPQDEKHIAFKERMPGRVDLWPLVEKTTEDKDGTWYDPVDHVSPQHHTVVLARRVAGFIKELIDTNHPLPIESGNSGTYQARPVRAGDILILVRRRSRLFTEIIRACKQAQLPIAGADRLKVMAELAVRDIGALLAFLATPEDDLSLATALRSPLFGLREGQLYDLAQGRGEKFLWVALRERAEDFPKVVQVLAELMRQTDFLRPYDLIERILTRHNGRRLLLGRLGEEAEDGIDALLQQALSYEQTEVPSLTGFLQWMQTDDLEIKRQADSAGDRIRVMTVHGAKGLEAPIVILPDCSQPSRDVRDSILTDDAGGFWKQKAESLPARQLARLQARKDADARERDRLLYVAMTRAEKWLVVAAIDDLGKQGDSWYEIVRSGMERAGALPHVVGFGDQGTGQGLRLQEGDWAALPMTRPQDDTDSAVAMPPWLREPAPDVPAAPETLSPSQLGGAKALAGAEGDESDAAKLRGTHVHLLLEVLANLPTDERATMADALLAREDVPADARPALVDEAVGVLDAPGLSICFAPDTLAEVAVSANLPGLGPCHGVIDRLIVGPDRVLAVDFKSNRTVPDTPETCPEGLLRQMGAYAAMLAQVYPDRRIETAFLWTRTAQMMFLPHDLVTQALERAKLDLPAPAT